MSIIRRRTASAETPVKDKKPAKDSSATAKEAVAKKPTQIELGPVLHKKELFDAVVARSGLRKGDVKLIVENTLAVLGEALQENRELNLPPFGKVKAQREKKVAGGRMVITKIRQNESVVTKPSELPKGPARKKPGA